jgi:transcriptional regulator with PAS, ATPase and Fis domain
VGSSAAYHIAMHKILRVAGTNATVLLLGESGVGKTMFAHELHSNSLRANTPSLKSTARRSPSS